jgi:heat-inducible transcriptional repressor
MVIHSAGGDELIDLRHQEVLRIVIHEHVRTGEPISSRLTARLHSEQLSAATIRNIMAELTEKGFLEQPHASAGRVPTDKGYRYFVDELLAARRKLPARDARRIEELLVNQREIKTVLSKSSKLLAELTNQVSVVLAPDLEAAQLEYIEFVRVSPRRVVAIIIGRSGSVTHRIVELDDDPTQEDLDRLALAVREQFVGLTLPEARARIAHSLREDSGWAQLLGQRAIAALEQWLASPFDDEPANALILEGTSHLLEIPEFKDVLRLREVMKTFDDRTRMLGLLDRCLAGRGVQVMIGAEAEFSSLSPMAVVASPYAVGPGAKGLVGIVGPRRMEYARAVALVDHFARTISEVLGRTASDDPQADRSPDT